MQQLEEITERNEQGLSRKEKKNALQKGSLIKCMCSIDCGGEIILLLQITCVSKQSYFQTGFYSQPSITGENRMS